MRNQVITRRWWMRSSMPLLSQNPMMVLKKECLLRISEAGAHSFQLSESSSEACLCPRVQVCSLSSLVLSHFLLTKFVTFLDLLLCIARPGYQVPNLLYQDSVDSNMLLLKKEYAWHIGGALPHHELEEWKLLYHSSLHGQSFNTFLGHTS